MRKRCRTIVDELVVGEWEKEVREHGDQWLKASELLAAYGYGRPKLDSEVFDEQLERQKADLSLADLRALAQSNPSQVRGPAAFALLTKEEHYAIARLPLSSEHQRDGDMLDDDGDEDDDSEDGE